MHARISLFPLLLLLLPFLSNTGTTLGFDIMAPSHRKLDGSQSHGFGSAKPSDHNSDNSQTHNSVTRPVSHRSTMSSSAASVMTPVESFEYALDTSSGSSIQDGSALSDTTSQSMRVGSALSGHSRLENNAIFQGYGARMGKVISSDHVTPWTMMWKDKCKRHPVPMPMPTSKEPADDLKSRIARRLSTAMLIQRRPSGTSLTEITPVSPEVSVFSKNYVEPKKRSAPKGVDQWIGIYAGQVAAGKRDEIFPQPSSNVRSSHTESNRRITEEQMVRELEVRERVSPKTEPSPGRSRSSSVGGSPQEGTAIGGTPLWVFLSTLPMPQKGKRGENIPPNLKNYIHESLVWPWNEVEKKDIHELLCVYASLVKGIPEEEITFLLGVGSTRRVKPHRHANSRRRIDPRRRANSLQHANPIRRVKPSHRANSFRLPNPFQFTNPPQRADSSQVFEMEEAVKGYHERTGKKGPVDSVNNLSTVMTWRIEFLTKAGPKKHRDALLKAVQAILTRILTTISKLPEPTFINDAWPAMTSGTDGLLLLLYHII